MLEKLLELGLREEGSFTLHSGRHSSVFWNIEKLFRYPYWIRVEAIKPFIWKIGLKNPELLVGIKTGGYLLAKDIGKCLFSHKLGLTMPVYSEEYYCRKEQSTFECLNTILLDDVMTTGGSIRDYLRKSDSVTSIAILVNRSGLKEIGGIPIISGLVADEVESA